jgi:proliferating cell nuclear antigen
MSKSRNLLEIRTGQTSVIRSLVDALKEFLDEANIECDSDGLRINAMDKSLTNFVQCELTNFETYHCPKKMYVGVSMEKLFKVIKMTNNSEVLSLMVDEKTPDVLQVINQTKDINKTCHSELSMLDLSPSDLAMPQTNFQSVIIMPSSDFQQMVRNLHSIAEDVEITKVNDTITFATAGKKQFNHSFVFRNLKFLENSDPDEVIVGTFSLSLLSTFVKCTNLSPFVELYLKNDFMLFLRYSCGSLGSIRFGTVPRIRK